MQFDEIRMKNASIQAAIEIDQDEGRNAVDPIDFCLHWAIKSVRQNYDGQANTILYERYNAFVLVNYYLTFVLQSLFFSIHFKLWYAYKWRAVQKYNKSRKWKKAVKFV